MNKYDQEVAVIQQAMEAAKKSPKGMDFPVLGPDQKFPINLYCNDSLEPSTSANNRSVYTRWIRNGTGLVNLYAVSYTHLTLPTNREV